MKSAVWLAYVVVIGSCSFVALVHPFFTSSVFILSSRSRMNSHFSVPPIPSSVPPAAECVVRRHTQPIKGFRIIVRYAITNKDGSKGLTSDGFLGGVFVPPCLVIPGVIYGVLRRLQVCTHAPSRVCTPDSDNKFCSTGYCRIGCHGGIRLHVYLPCTGIPLSHFSQPIVPVGVAA